MTADDDNDTPEFLEIESLEDVDDSGTGDEEASGGNAGIVDLPDIVSQPRKPEGVQADSTPSTEGTNAGREATGEEGALANIVGRRLEGTYEIVEQIGQGGMGTVYAAIQHPLERKVAIKLVKPSDRADGSEHYFKREVRAIHTLRHPNIINIVDFGADAGGILYLVTEYLPGRTLREVIDEDYPLDPLRICHVTQQMLDALEEAHSEGVVHCDLKPANIMLEPVPDEGDFVKVLDFGIAEIKSPHHEVGPHTEEGDLVGTFDYMSPEQIMREEVDGRADVWSVGVLLYEMLTKRRIFHDDDGASIIGRVMRSDIPRPEELAEGVPPELSDVVMGALQRDLEERHSSAAAMRRRILEARDEIESRQSAVAPTADPEESLPPRETASRPIDPGGRGAVGVEPDDVSAEVARETPPTEDVAAPNEPDGSPPNEPPRDAGGASPADIESLEVDDDPDASFEEDLADEIVDVFEDQALEETLFEGGSEALEEVSSVSSEQTGEPSTPTTSEDERPLRTETPRDDVPAAEREGCEGSDEEASNSSTSSEPLASPHAPPSTSSESTELRSPTSSTSPASSDETRTSPTLTGAGVRIARPSIERMLLRGAATVPERGGRAIHVLGPTESGKSSLVDRTVEALEERDWAVVRARGDGPGGASLVPVMQWIAGLAGLYRDPSGCLRQALTSLGLEVGIDETVHFYAHPDVRGEDVERLPWESPSELRRVTARLLHRLVEFVGREMPVLLTLDHFDDGDVSLSSFLQTFSNCLERHPLCLLVTSPSLASRKHIDEWSRWHLVELEGWTEQQYDAYLEKQLEPLPSRAVREAIARHSGRLPGYLLEWLRWWVAHPDASPEQVPTRIEAVLQSHLRELAPSIRRSIGFLSVLGRHFPVSALEAVRPDSVEETALLERLLDQERAETWTDHAGRLRFELRPEPLEDLAYRMLDESRRRHYHGELIAFYEGAPDSNPLDPQEEALRLAFHYQGLDRDEEAAAQWFRAGRLRFERCNYTGAIRVWQDALEALEAMPELADDHPHRVRTLMRLIETHRELEAFDRAADLCDRLPPLSSISSRLLTDVLLEVGCTRLECGELDESRRLFRRLYTEASERGDDDKAFRALLYLADIREETGDVPGSVETLRGARQRLAALESSEPGLDELRWRIPNRLGALFLEHDRLARAEEYFREARQRARDVQSRAGFVRIDSNLGALALKRGRLERARSHFENARSTARATGDVLNQARIDINVGVAAMQHGDLEAAREAFYEARDIAGEIGWKEGLERLAPRIEELHLALE